ncbi:MAG: 30S ribosomal protein S6 [Actinobacteria bacterium]|nr:30S ribosomal protein S6 [Actinomycetota bacterium]
MRGYEIMLILPPDAEEPAVGEVVDRVSRILAEQGGEIGKVDRWGRRRLAYEIDKQAEGYYVVAEFRAEPTALKELDRVLSLADDVIRFKVVLRAA